jgi:hypothetical protein
MSEFERDTTLRKEMLTHRLKNHREYVTRQWQYFASFILLNGLLINAIKDLGAANPLLVTVLGLAFITASAVFFHLINWTDMRIHRNAKCVNQLAGQDLIELPGPTEGITTWLLFSIVIFALCWVIWLYQIGPLSTLLGIILFAIICGNSLMVTRRWLKHS